MAAKPRFDGEWVRLGDVCEVVGGSTPKTDDPGNWGGDIKWVTPAEIRESVNLVTDTLRHVTPQGVRAARLRIMPAGTVLLTTRAPIGKVSLAGDEMCCNQGFKCLICSPAISNEWLLRLLRYNSYELQQMGTGATFKELSKKAVSHYRVKLPAMASQQAAVKRLTCLEKLLEDLRGQLALLDQLVKSRFVEMFGDPTVPGDRWPVSRLDGFTKIITGNTPSRKHAEYYGDGIEWVKTDNIVDSTITTASERLTKVGRSKARVAPTGSILMACIAGSVKSIGKVGLLDREAAFNQQINAIVPTDVVDSRYLLTMLTLSKNYLCSDVNQQLKGILNKSNLSSKQFPLPPLSLQQEFASFVAEVDKSRFIVQQQIEKLQTLYDSLAQEYFS